MSDNRGCGCYQCGVKEALEEDLKVLNRMAFRRIEKCGDLVRRYHSLNAKQRKHSAFSGLQKIHRWLLSPFTVWPIDFAGFADHLLGLIERGKDADAYTNSVLALVDTPPLKAEQSTISAHEIAVEAGEYEALIAAQPKFDDAEQRLFENSEFQRDWSGLCEQFDVDSYRNRNKIIRRRMWKERGFSPEGWVFCWKKIEDRFRIAFDAFCHKWNLYGMEGDLPLLQKISVNVTPFGTMIFVPRYWSFDWKRDLKWKTVNKIHRSRGVQKQGEKHGQNRRERFAEARNVSQFWNDAGHKGLRGDARYSYVIQGMGWDPRTDPRRVRRSLALLKNQ